MAIDQEDTHLLEAIAASMTRARAIDHDPAARGWVQSAVELLETAQEGFEQLVEREDVEEDEAQEALGQMRQARQDVIAAFTDVIGALEIKLGERRLAHSEDPTEQKKTQVLARFLQHWSGGELASLRTDRLSSVARSALTLAKQHEASSIATSALDHAVEELDEARTLAGEEGARGDRGVCASGGGALGGAGVLPDSARLDQRSAPLSRLGG